MSIPTLEAMIRIGESILGQFILHIEAKLLDSHRALSVILNLVEAYIVAVGLPNRIEVVIRIGLVGSYRVSLGGESSIRII